MVVELLWWAGCPSTDKALVALREALAELKLNDVTIRVSEIATDDEAQAVGFAGSPTILIDGADIAPLGPEEPVGLSCRVYLRRDGTVSPIPDPEDMRDALRRAAALRR